MLWPRVRAQGVQAEEEARLEQRHETNGVLGVVRYCCRLECNWRGSRCAERGVAADQANGWTSS